MNKAIRRFLCIALGIILSFSACLGFAENENLQENSEVVTPIAKEELDDNSAIKFLSELGVFKGYEDGKLHPEYNITRMEFTALIVRALGLDETKADSTQFTDVPLDLWGAGYIETARIFGIVNGYPDGTFRPENNVTVTEAAKIMVGALGYTYMAEELGGYPTGYLSIAQRNDILKGISNLNAEATRGDVAQMIRNSLELKFLAKTVGENKYTLSDETLLSSMKITKVRGMVTGIHNNNLLSTDEIEENKCIFNGNQYLVDKPIKIEKLGRDGIAYILEYNDVAKRTLLSFVPDNAADDFTFDANDIMPTTTKTKFVYVQNEKIKELNLANDLRISYNGKMITRSSDMTSDKLKPDNGTVTLLDFNDDNVFDIAIVKDYETMVVRNKTLENIYGLYGGYITYKDEKNEDIRVTVTYNDEDATIEDIQIDDVLSVAVSCDGEVIDIIINREETTGYIYSQYTESGKTYLKIGETEDLEIDKQYRDAISGNVKTAVEIELGMYVKAYLNYFGEIAAVVEEAAPSDEGMVSSSKAQYAYVIETFEPKASYSEMQILLEVLDSNNRIINLWAGQEKILFGAESGPEYIVSKRYPADVRTQVYGQKKALIKYVADENGEISELYLLDSNTTRGNFCLSMKGRYDVSNGAIDRKYIYDENTVVFSIPQLGAYKELISSGRYYNYYGDTQNFTVQLYDIQKDGYVPVIYATTDVASEYYAWNKHYIDYVNSPVMYVQEVYSELDEKGLPYTIMAGYENGEYVKTRLSDTLAKDANIKPGIAIQYQTNKKWLTFAETSEDLEVAEVYMIVHDFTNTNQENYVMSEYESGAVNGTRIQVEYANASEYNHPRIKLNKTNYYYNVHGYTSVYKYDVDARKFTQATVGDIYEGARVFVRLRSNNMRELVIVE